MPRRLLENSFRLMAMNQESHDGLWGAVVGAIVLLAITIITAFWSGIRWLFGLSQEIEMNKRSVADLKEDHDNLRKDVAILHDDMLIIKGLNQAQTATLAEILREIKAK